MKNCIDYEMMISASIDNELSSDEQTQLDYHLQSCGPCRQQFDTFQLLEVQLRQDDNASAIPINGTMLMARAADAKRDVAYARPRSRAGRNFLMLSGAAAALAAIVVPQWNTEQPQNSIDHDLFRPISELERINEQSTQQQRDLARSMEYELRAIRLELASFREDPDTNAALNDKIDSMLTQVRRWSNPAAEINDNSVNE